MGFFSDLKIAVEEAGCDERRFVKYAGISYEVIDDVELYVDILKRMGTSPIKATVRLYATARLAREGETVINLNNDGNADYQQVAKSGDYVITKTDKRGEVLLNGLGNPRRLLASREDISRFYEPCDIDTDEDIRLVSVAKPRTLIPVDRNIALVTMLDGREIHRVVEFGGYVDITDINDINVVSEGDFKKRWETLYVINKCD